MNLAVQDAGAWRKLGEGALINGVWFVGSTIEGMSPAERSALGVVEYQPAGPIPAGQRVASTYLANEGGGVVEKRVLEPIPLQERKDALLAAIDAERDRRQQLDAAYDFGSTLAIDDAGQEAAAGVKALQMRFEPDQRNWQALQSQAVVAVMMGQGGAVMPMRVEDNYNVQTSAEQVLAVTSALVQRNAAILFHGGALKSQVRNANTGSELDAININIGWPG